MPVFVYQHNNIFTFIQLLTMINYIILYTAFSIQKKTRKTIKISTNPKYARGKSNKTCKCGGGKDYIIIFSVFVWDLEKKLHQN